MKISKRLFNLETETAFTILSKTNKLIYEGKDIINCAIGIPSWSPPSKYMSDFDSSYSTSYGEDELRQELVKYYFHYNTGDH